MNKEKLNKAAELHSNAVFNEYPEDVTDNTLEFECNKAFRRGANWLMQQPLSERLTDAEIAKAKAAYNRAEECYNNDADDMSYASGLVVKTVLKEIFGAELFKD